MTRSIERIRFWCEWQRQSPLPANLSLTNKNLKEKSMDSLLKLEVLKTLRHYAGQLAGMDGEYSREMETAVHDLTNRFEKEI